MLEKPPKSIIRAQSNLESRARVVFRRRVVGGFARFGRACGVGGAAAQNRRRRFYFDGFETGQVIAEQDADVRLPPASLAKIMTVSLFFARWTRGGCSESEKSRSRQRRGKPAVRGCLSSRKLLSPSAICCAGWSCNRATTRRLLSRRRFAGDEESFVQVMNQQSRELGLENTQWGSSSGLPRKSQWASARDIAILTREMIARYPEDYALYAEKEFTYNGITQKNRNRLLDTYPGADGIKTGYTKAAGYSLAASATRDGGRRLVAVVMKTKSAKARAQSCARLLDYGFSHFETAVFFDEGKTRSLSIWGGDADSVPVRVLADSGKMVLPRGTKWKTEVEIESKLWAPIEKGGAVGRLRVRDEAGEVWRNIRWSPPKPSTRAAGASNWSTNSKPNIWGMTKPIAYLNGDFLPLAEARVSPLDRGFLFADGVYEVAPVYGRRLFCWSRHLRRLERSLRAVDLPFAVDDLTPIARELTARQGFADQSLYLQITRGAGATRAFAPPPDLSPTVFAFCAPFAPPVALAQKGIAATTIEDIRWRRADINRSRCWARSWRRRRRKSAARRRRFAARRIFARGLFEQCVRGVCGCGRRRDCDADRRSFDFGGNHARDCHRQRAPFGLCRARAGDCARGIDGGGGNVDLLFDARDFAGRRMDGNALGDGRPGAVFRAVYADFQARKESLCEN